MAALESLSEQFADRVAFFVVYIREAHPEDGWVSLTNRDEGIAVADPTSLAERAELAEACALRLKIRMPVLLDGPDDTVARQYGGWPDRLYLVGRDGRIAFQGEEGPMGFAAQHLELAIVDELAGGGGARDPDDVTVGTALGLRMYAQMLRTRSVAEARELPVGAEAMTVGVSSAIWSTDTVVSAEELVGDLVEGMASEAAKTGRAVAWFLRDADSDNQMEESVRKAVRSAFPIVYVCSSAAALGGAVPELPVSRVDGRDVRAVYAAAAQAVERARAGAGPSLLVCDVASGSGDPIELHGSWLLREGHATEGVLRRLSHET